MKKIIIAIVLCLILASSTYSQSEMKEIITDRPDKTESAASIPLGCYQIESGFVLNNRNYSIDKIDFEEQNISLFNTLARFGLGSEFELRVGAGYFSNSLTESKIKSTSQGVGDLMLGAKYIFREDEEIFTNAGLLFETVLPFGAKGIRPENFDPKLLFLVEQDLTDDFGIGINFGGEYSSTEAKYFYDYTATLGIELGKRFGCFFEFYGQTSSKSAPGNYVDCGLTYLQSSNIQYDISFGSGLTPNMKDYFVGFGAAIRLPK